MKSVLDSASIDMACPRCGQKTAKTIGWLKANNQITCPGCGGDIDIDPGNLVEVTGRVEKTLDGLNDSIRRINKRN